MTTTIRVWKQLILTQKKGIVCAIIHTIQPRLLNFLIEDRFMIFGSVCKTDNSANFTTLSQELGKTLSITLGRKQWNISIHRSSSHSCGDFYTQTQNQLFELITPSVEIEIDENPTIQIWCSLFQELKYGILYISNNGVKEKNPTFFVINSLLTLEDDEVNTLQTAFVGFHSILWSVVEQNIPFIKMSFHPRLPRTRIVMEEFAGFRQSSGTHGIDLKNRVKLHPLRYMVSRTSFVSANSK
ncbi:hypothetical protein RF11_04755 [Thelohanellus kitauei]|uniref:Uncharacterized protein n=1 Tax=Thelohanellus kitauei TaxID=669202 RepID=A0A0C2J024_THEKT|nr:hypothetical protein RF11_04755 [Thelohanellus kitauei]